MLNCDLSANGKISKFKNVLKLIEIKMKMVKKKKFYALDPVKQFLVNEWKIKTAFENRKLISFL